MRVAIEMQFHLVAQIRFQCITTPLHSFPEGRCRSFGLCPQVEAHVLIDLSIGKGGDEEPHVTIIYQPCNLFQPQSFVASRRQNLQQVSVVYVFHVCKGSEYRTEKQS